MSDIKNFPLCWPDNVPRTAPHSRKHPNFGVISISRAAELVSQEVNRLNGRHWDYTDETLIISTNVRPTLRGIPAANQAEPADAGVAVYFKLRFVRNGKWFERPVVLTCDKWVKTCDNLKAISKDIEAQRARARWGCTNLEQAFRGYVAIPERCGGKSWWDLLDLPSSASEAEIKDRFRDLAAKAHPDAGGNRLEWDRLIEARDQALSQFVHEPTNNNHNQ